MTKEFCDLCGRELYNGQIHRRFKIKELKSSSVPQDWGPRWVNIVAHDRCIEALISNKKEED